MSVASTVQALNLYFKMLRIRMVEEEIVKRYEEQEMRCPVHLCIGQEAIAVGVSHHLRKEDYVLSNHRAHAHFLAKGGALPQMIAEIYGKKTGCAKGRGGSMHLVDLNVGFLGSTPIVGGTLPVAVGVAFAQKMQGKENVTCVYFGEGATEEGVFAESLNFAALKHLPLLFICENNLYSVYSPLSVRQPEARSRILMARAHGIYAREGEGMDVECVEKMTKEAIAHIRSGKGPAFLEFSTYRYVEHCGPNQDDHLGYRSFEEVATWKEKDPLKVFQRKYVREQEERVREEFHKEIEAAFRFAKESAFPVTQGELYASH